MSFMINKNKIVMTRGDTVRVEISIEYDESHMLYDISADDTLRFTLKKYIYDNEALIQKEASHTDNILELAPEDTKDLPFGEYRYNIELITAEGNTYTVIPNSIFIIAPEV